MSALTRVVGGVGWRRKTIEGDLVGTGGGRSAGLVDGEDLGDQAAAVGVQDGRA